MELSIFSLSSGLGGLILLGLCLWALVSIVNSTATTGRKVLWALLVVLLPLIGFILWLIAGPRAAPGRI